MRGTRERVLRISLEFGNRRRQTPTISLQTSLGQPRGKASAGQHRLPGGGHAEVESKILGVKIYDRGDGEMHIGR